MQNDTVIKLEKLELAIEKIALSMATKQDVGQLEISLSKIKEDLSKTEKRLLEKIDDSQAEIIAVVDKHKADKTTVIALEKRVQRLENSI